MISGWAFCNFICERSIFTQKGNKKEPQLTTYVAKLRFLFGRGTRP